MATYDVGLKIGIEGDASFTNQLKLINQQTKELNAEMKSVSAAFDKNDKSEAKLSATAAVLTKQMENQSAKVALLKEKLSEQEKELERIGTEYQKVVEEQGENSAAAQKLANDYARQSTAISKTRTDLNNAETTYNQAANAMDHLGDEAEEAGNQIGNSFAKDVATATVVMGKMVDVAIDVGKRVVEVGKKAVKYNMQMESYSRTIEAFFKTSGQGAEEAAANTAELLQNQKDLAAQIGIGSDKLIDANKMLIAAGVDGQKSQKAVSALAKAVVAVGGGNEELSRMASNLQQIQSVGKASSADMKQFSMAGVDVYGLMAETTGKTVDQLKEMDITFDMIVEALDHATQEGGKFFEASQVGASTLQGQFNLLESTIQEGLGTAFQPFNDALQNEILPQVQELVDGIDWEALGEMMADAAEVAVDAFGILVNTLNELAEAYGIVKDAVDDWGNVEDRVTTDVANNYLGTAGAFKKAYDEHERFASDAQVGMDTIINKTTQVNKSIAHMPTTWTEAAPLAKNAGQEIADSLEKPLNDAVSDSNQYGADFVDGLANGMQGKVGVLSYAANTLANAIRNVLHFSRPEEGPLRDYENWMPDFVAGLADTMKANEWKLADAAQGLASTITNNAVTNNISMSVYGSSGQDPNQLADLVMVRIQEATNRRNAVWA